MAKDFLMTKYTNRCKRGFYTVEAAIFLPLTILAVLTVGYFLRADAAWENHMYASYEKYLYAQTVSPGFGNPVHIRRVHMEMNLPMPIGFGHGFEYRDTIKYRDFVGLKYKKKSLGAEGLENDSDSLQVWIFPQSGKRYHDENCTYVKASVHSCILTESVKRRFSACSICDSGELPAGSIVFCFQSKKSCYHRGNCRSINRHVITIDKKEAEAKGYTPCSKCFAQ